MAADIYAELADAGVDSTCSWTQAMSASSAGSDVSDGPRVSSPVGYIPDDDPSNEGRPDLYRKGCKAPDFRRSHERVSSKERASSHGSKESSNKKGFRCYCHCGNVTARLAFYPVERLDDILPDVCVAQMRSTAFIFLLPVNSAHLQAECIKHQQRLDEVLFNTRRKHGALPDPGSPTGGSRDPRLACIALHINVQEESMVLGDQEPPSELGELITKAPEIGVASIDDDVSLWSAIEPLSGSFMGVALPPKRT